MNPMFLAIDIGGTMIKSAIVDKTGTVIEKSSVSTPPDSLEDFLEVIEQIIIAKIDWISGIGFSIPGTIDSEEGVIYNGGSLTYLHQVPLKKIIFEKFKKPVFMENDGKAAALAESFKGELQNVSNGAVIVIGTGIGSGIILNGELYMGSNFQSGELSFMIESNSNSDKLMGLSYSGVEMIKQISKVLNLDSNNNGEKVFEFIRKKNPIALAHFEKYCDGIALLIHNVQVVLDLQTIVIPE